MNQQQRNSIIIIMCLPTLVLIAQHSDTVQQINDPLGSFLPKIDIHDSYVHQDARNCSIHGQQECTHNATYEYVCVSVQLWLCASTIASRYTLITAVYIMY